MEQVRFNGYRVGELLFTHNKHLFLHKKNRDNKQEVISNRKRWGEKINRDSVIKGDRWHPMLGKLAKEDLCGEAILKHWSWSQNGQQEGSNLKIKQKVTANRGNDKSQGPDWGGR